MQTLIRTIFLCLLTVFFMSGCSGSTTTTDASTDSDDDAGIDAGSDPGSDPNGDPGADPGSDPGADPGGDPGADPGSDPGADQGSDPGADQGGDNDAGTDSCTTTSCQYGGNTYEDGESFWADDACNKCSCNGGQVGCTEELCPCTGDEWFRDYLDDDPGTCASIIFNCPQYTVEFHNDCGCGCQQSPECDQVYDCEPPPPPDCSWGQEHCPYSTIAW
ncbi:MAG: hypothetical protein JRJ87_19940 [Deltaproteobacteria bacterium]|nr:hypothetical protein [Deltaproteobacteria bacterium]